MRYKVIAHTNDHSYVSTPWYACWQLQVPACQLGYSKTSPDGESLNTWAAANNLALLHNPDGVASISSHRWKVGSNPDLEFASLGQDNRLPVPSEISDFIQCTHAQSNILHTKYADKTDYWGLGIRV